MGIFSNIFGEDKKGFFTYNGHLIFSFSNFYKNDMFYYPAFFCDGDGIEFETNFGDTPFKYSNQEIINSVDNINMDKINNSDKELVSS